MSDKRQLLKVLKQSILEARLCPKLADQATQLVLGDGNPDAEVVFIGEAPGKKEDETGKPFVGASGKFLDTMLESVGMSRADIYITNIVKYRPPNNRDPTRTEKDAFWPYLKTQLEIIDPKVIVTLGRHSMEFFIPDAKIGEVHGQTITQAVEYEDGSMHEWQIAPLYHPAAALYNGKLRQTLIDDFVRLKSYLTL